MRKRSYSTGTSVHEFNAMPLIHFYKRFDRLIEFILADSQTGAFSVVYPDWEIYDAVERTFIDTDSRGLLETYGVSLSITDVEDSKPIYLMEYKNK
jgi:hypothetical protein